MNMFTESKGIMIYDKAVSNKKENFHQTCKESGKKNWVDLVGNGVRQECKWSKIQSFTKGSKTMFTKFAGSKLAIFKQKCYF